MRLDVRKRGLTLINLKVETFIFHLYSEGTSRNSSDVRVEPSKKLKARVEKKILVKKECTNVENTVKE